MVERATTIKSLETDLSIGYYFVVFEGSEKAAG